MQIPPKYRILMQFVVHIFEDFPWNFILKSGGGSIHTTNFQSWTKFTWCLGLQGLFSNVNGQSGCVSKKILFYRWILSKYEVVTASELWERAFGSWSIEISKTRLPDRKIWYLLKFQHNGVRGSFRALQTFLGAKNDQRACFRSFWWVWPILVFFIQPKHAVWLRSALSSPESTVYPNPHL